MNMEECSVTHKLALNLHSKLNSRTMFLWVMPLKIFLTHYELVYMSIYHLQTA